MVLFLRHFNGYFKRSLSLCRLIHCAAEHKQRLVFGSLNGRHWYPVDDAKYSQELSNTHASTFSAKEGEEGEEKEDEAASVSLSSSLRSFSFNVKTYAAVLQSFRELIAHLGTRLSPFAPILFHTLSLCLRDAYKERRESVGVRERGIDLDENEEGKDGEREVEEDDEEEEREEEGEGEEKMEENEEKSKEGEEESDSEVQFADDGMEEGEGERGEAGSSIGASERECDLAEASAFATDGDLFTKKRQKVIAQTIARMTDLLSKFPFVSQANFAFAYYLSVCRRVVSSHLFLKQDTPSVLLSG